MGSPGTKSYGTSLSCLQLGHHSRLLWSLPEKKLSSYPILSYPIHRRPDTCVLQVYSASNYQEMPRCYH